MAYVYIDPAVCDQSYLDDLRNRARARMHQPKKPNLGRIRSSAASRALSLKYGSPYEQSPMCSLEEYNRFQLEATKRKAEEELKARHHNVQKDTYLENLLSRARARMHQPRKPNLGRLRSSAASRALSIKYGSPYEKSPTCSMEEYKLSQLGQEKMRVGEQRLAQYAGQPVNIADKQKEEAKETENEAQSEKDPLEILIDLLGKILLNMVEEAPKECWADI